jgi:sulfotransferase family protein
MRVQDLIDAARARSGLDDFGNDSFREGLEHLVESIDRESTLNDLGKLGVPEMLIAQLISRLEVEHWYRTHPEIDDEQIVAPLFGVGLPRTGSTALVFMLAQDPNNRSLRMWEADKPCPPPEYATQHTDPRIAVCAANIEMGLERCPERRVMLPWDAEGPTECLGVMFLDFKFQAYEAFLHVPSYIDWLNSPACDMEPAYRYHKRVLKLLQWRCPPRRWSLKSPTHMLYINALNKVYPDARFVMTHRHPAQVLPSLADLLWSTRRDLLADPLERWYARHAMEEWATAIGRLMELRDRLGPARFYDIAFRNFMADPIREIRGLYQWLGWELDDNTVKLMLAWQANNPKGSHKVAMEKYGLDEQSIGETYRLYTERFAALL